jgi:malate dehydrogenase (oxaloacetate-decarboxylating)
MKIPEIIIVDVLHQPGSLAKVLQVIAEEGLVLENLTSLRRENGRTLWEITLEMDEDANRSLYERIDKLPNARFVGKSDRVFNRHRGGKIRTISRVSISTPNILRDVYTPGVARVCLAIKADPRKIHDYTAIDNTVAIITNGTAILGLGDIGAAAGLPVMEGKAALFSELVDISGVPILLKTRDVESVVATILAIEQSFGAIQLEDFAAPECFEIEERLSRMLDKPVLHDDQHGTAVVTLAALLTATRRLGRSLRACTIGQIGLGAAGTGIVRLLRAYGVSKVLGADRNPAAIERIESLGAERASLADIMARCDIVIATTGVKNLIPAASVRPGQIIFALSNPESEIDPLAAMERGAAYAADGKAINNVLAFPGLFRGALAAHAPRFTDAMLMAAADAIAQAAGEDLVPNPLDRKVHERVAAAVMSAATLSD